jgi:MoaA/NifB/PqqE/SkfB family radical SAM enzyme
MNLKEYGYNIIGLEINGSCNFICKYCLMQLCPNKGSFMPLEKIYHILDQIIALGGNELEMIYLNVFGEPMAHPDIFKILHYMRTNKLHSHLVSNGSFLHNKNLDQLTIYSPDKFHISLNVLNKEKFLSLRGTNISIDDYVENIIELIKRMFYKKIDGLNVLKIDFMSLFYSRFKRMIGALPKESILPEVYHSKSELYKDILPFMEKISNAIPEFVFDKQILKKNITKNTAYHVFSGNALIYAIRDNIRLIITEYLPLIHYDKKHVESSDNTCFRASIEIMNNGVVSLCCLDYFQELAVGNIFEESLESILAKAENIRAVLKNNAKVYNLCRQCKNYFSIAHKITEPFMLKYFTK